jgi:hypothetical protein
VGILARVRDVFGTAGIRERVLAGWAASAARFREDANAEEDLALGGYRDRLVVELAQNAADAAARAGITGRVRFTLYDEDGRPTLAVANTGEPLTAEGVQSLATLRASAKRDAETTVGRFGVGFASVLAVTDEPAVLSRTGGVRFSRQDTAAAVDQIPSLQEEVRRRDGHLPVLRLPFETDGEPPEGFHTAVLLPLHDEAAADLVRRLLQEADDALLLALPALDRIEIDVYGNHKTLADAADRWQVQRAAGPIDARLLADRPTEERARPFWSVLWALPRSPGTNVPMTVHAPTPTDEPLSLRALLLATFPLDPSRRHVAPGPLTDMLVHEAATAYAELARQHDDPLGLVPAGLAKGVLDASLREAIIAVLPGTAILRAAEDGAPIRPRDAVVVDRADDALVEVLAPVVSGLVRSTVRTALDVLGVRRLDLADLVDELQQVSESPDWWRTMYAALTAMVADPLTREALGALPVPLADGRIVRGARGLLLPGEGLPADVLAALGPYGLRVVHPQAAHDTLERLGAVPAGPRALLDDGAVRAAVQHSMEADDPDAIAETVLTIAGAAGIEHEDWLADLALRDAEGELVPAGSLVIPGSEAEAVLDPDEFAPVAADLLGRHAQALERVGVLRTLSVTKTADVALDLMPDDLDGIERWAREVAPAGSTAGELSAVRDLDCVIDWPRALALFGTDPVLRDALVRPVRVAGPGNPSADVTAYTAWWIRRNVGLAGLADPDADPVLAELLEPAPEWVSRCDPEVRRAVGLVRRAEDLDAPGVRLVLERLAEDRDVPAEAMLRLWPALAEAHPGEPPARVRVLDGESTRVVDADQAVLADAPMWLQRSDLGGYVVATGPAADGLADLLDLPLAGDVAAGRIETKGEPAPVPGLVRRLIEQTPETWWQHEDLIVDGQQVSWWVDENDGVHAATTDGLANALAWAARRWDRRHLILAALTEPERAAELIAETAFEED